MAGDPALFTPEQRQLWEEAQARAAQLEEEKQQRRAQLEAEIRGVAASAAEVVDAFDAKLSEAQVGGLGCLGLCKGRLEALGGAFGSRR